jgi:hypothetical protein
MNNHATYLKWIITFLGIALLPATFLAAIYEPHSGDLTRLGALDENSFGWNLEQPIQRIHQNPTSLSPSVLVIGDSFSYGNIWQSFIKEKYGLDFVTLRWDQFKSVGLCAIEDSQKKFPSLQLVIFESVEMGSIGHINEANNLLKQPCNSKTNLNYPMISNQMTENTRNKNGFIRDPIFLYKILANNLKPLNELSLFGKTYRLKMKRKGLFSSKNSGYGLFYKNEIDDKNKWSDKDINFAKNKLHRIKDRLFEYGLKVSFLVIPDKSTAYANEIIPKDLLPQNNFWSEMQISANFVSLLDEFQEAATTIVDFYLPNDTHLSTSGYQYLAEHLYNATLKKIDISDQL